MVATETGYSPFLTSDDVTERMGEVFYGLKLWEGMSPIRREKGRARFLDVMSAAITRSQALDRIAADERPAMTMPNVVTFFPALDLAPSKVVAIAETETARHYMTINEVLVYFQDRLGDLERAVAELQRVPGNSYSSIVTERIEDGE